MSWRLTIEPDFDNVGPDADRVEAAMGCLSTANPELVRKFVRSRNAVDTANLAQAMSKLLPRLPPHMRWQNPRRREGTAQTREGTADRLATAETPRTPESQRATP